MSTLNLVNASGKRFQHVHFPIDAVGLEERATSFTKRSIKNESKLEALLWVLKMMDLTTLEGMDSPKKVEQMCMKALMPFTPRLLEIAMNKGVFQAGEPIARPAAVCVYPDMVPYAHEILKNSDIHIASVATAFPSGRLPMDMKLKDVARAIEFGADEIDMVIDRGMFLAGHHQQVIDDVARVKEVCGENVQLKVILETGELHTYDNIRLASWLAMEGGADFIKTSTGKVQPAATMPVTLLMLQAIADFQDQRGIKIGMKPAGGVRTAKQAIHYLVMVNEVLGSEWLTPDWFRFGASVLMNDVMRQIYFKLTGHYADYESVAWE